MLLPLTSMLLRWVVELIFGGGISCFVPAALARLRGTWDASAFRDPGPLTAGMPVLGGTLRPCITLSVDCCCGSGLWLCTVLW